MTKIEKAYQKLMKIVEGLLTASLVVDVLLVTAQVFCRYVLRSPIGWSEQICRLIFLWAVMLGVPVTFYEKSDMTFDLIFNKLPFKSRRILAIFYAILGIIFSIFYFICAFQLVAATGSRMTTGIVMPVNILYSAQIVCAVLMVIVFIERLINRFKDKPDKKEGEE